VILTKPVERLGSIGARSADEAPVVALNKTSIPPIALEKTPAVRTAPNLVRRSPLVRRKASLPEPLRRSESLWTNQAPVYIAIPADALFPPGAFPEGVGFVADVNLRPDGSAQRLRLQPQLVGFQRRGAQP
jgi:hypothetical protein